MFDNFLVVGLCALNCQVITCLSANHLLTFYLPLISILHPNYSKETKETANFGGNLHRTPVKKRSLKDPFDRECATGSGFSDFFYTTE